MQVGSRLSVFPPRLIEPQRHAACSSTTLLTAALLVRRRLSSFVPYFPAPSLHPCDPGGLCVHQEAVVYSATDDYFGSSSCVPAANVGHAGNGYPTTATSATMHMDFKFLKYSLTCTLSQALQIATSTTRLHLFSYHQCD